MLGSSSSGAKLGVIGEGKGKGKKNQHRSTLTIDGDSNGLGQSVAIGTLESGDLAQRVNLAVSSAGVSLSVWLSLNQLQVKVVVLGSDQDGDGTRVGLKQTQRKEVRKKKQN